jgi:hypothetical protein
MTNHIPKEPAKEGDSSRASSPGQESPRGVYNPIRLDDGQNRRSKWLDDLNSPIVRLFVALLFLIILGIAWNRPEFGPITIVVLAGCLLYRLENWQRELAAAPLVLAAIRLCLLLPTYVSEWTPRINPFNGTVSRTPGGDFGMPWLPAFLSVCLFFLPRKDFVTLKIVVVEALAVILSGLLPGAGFVSILAIFHYTLFFAIAVGLVVDLKPGLRKILSEAGNPHAPIEARPVTVRIHPTPPPPRPAGAL